VSQNKKLSLFHEIVLNIFTDFMKQDLKHLFHSKILLFGEYSLMLGSMALSIPFKKFNGRFVYNPDFKIPDIDIKSNFQIDDYLNYLEAISSNNNSDFLLDVPSLRDDIKKGFVFKSNIPISYGLGSSGALVAAIYSKYGNPQVQDFNNTDQIKQLKGFLSQLESYFHGKSSGLDPLLSYLDHPLLIDENGEIELVNLPKWQKYEPGTFFLVDSKTSSETQPLVDLFVKKCEDNQFNSEIRAVYIPTVNACIRAYLQMDLPVFQKNLIKLSEFQIKYFQEMIPEQIKPLWKAGLDSEKYTLKLCGSGGGGMILGFGQDFKVVQSEIRDYKIIKVHSM